MAGAVFGPVAVTPDGNAVHLLNVSWHRNTQVPLDDFFRERDDFHVDGDCCSQGSDVTGAVGLFVSEADDEDTDFQFGAIDDGWPQL